jgi:hypothetical protein
LGDNDIGDMIIDRFPQENYAVFKKAGVDVIGSFNLALFFDYRGY